MSTTPSVPPADDSPESLAWLQTAAERESWAALGQLLEANVPRLNEEQLLQRVLARVGPAVEVARHERVEAAPPWLALAASVALLLSAGWGAMRSAEVLSPVPRVSVPALAPTADAALAHAAHTHEPPADVWQQDDTLAAELTAVETSIVLFEERMRTSAWELAAMHAWLDDLQRGWEQEGL